MFGIPNRVSYHGLYYINRGNIVILKGDELPKYNVSRFLDIVTGKQIFSNEKDYIGNGKVVYLHLNGNRYLVLGCGGGG